MQLLLRWSVLTGLLSVLTVPVIAAPWCEVVAPADSPTLVQQAASELSAYLSRLTVKENGGQTIPVVNSASGAVPAIILKLEPAGDLHEEEFYIRPTGNDQVVIQACTPSGIQQGAYRLLREYGFGFYFDGDAAPEALPTKFQTPQVHGNPVFNIRGSLPWYNFFNSPTTWDDQDFRFFADQIIRSGQNFIGFHTYDYEPFAAYSWEDSLLGGEPLMTTAQRVWGSWPMSVSEFGFGTSRNFLGENWSSDVAMQPGAREEKIRREKALLARGLSYASARGVKTCLGFEVSGDPTNPLEQARFKARLTQLLRDYPMLDYVWLWQPEGMSMEGSTPPALRSQGGQLYRYWEAAFSYVEKPARMWEGMRVAYYSKLARELMDTVSPDVKLVLSGWGGDNWLHVSDYFPAWDKVLDKRIIFAALDDISVRPQVSVNYKLSKDRERWAIPWYEYDGDQWYPQANAHIFADTVRDAKAKGCQGLLGIHWRTKEVGESQAICAKYAWEPETETTSFYRDYGIKRFGAETGVEIGRILQELDALKYRWIGGSGQSECGGFAWCYVNDAARVNKIKQLRAQLVEAAKQLDDTVPSGATGRLQDTLDTIDRSLMFNEVAGLLVAGGPVEKALNMDASDPKKIKACRNALAKLAASPAEKMMQKWASTITSRGELGVLATVNAKAVYDYRDKAHKLHDALGIPWDEKTFMAEKTSTSGIISDYQLTSVAAGCDLPLRVVAWDGQQLPKRVVALYQGEKDADCTAIELKHRERAVFEGKIPGADVKPGWLRYWVIAEYPGKEVWWPQLRGENYRQVTVFPTEQILSRKNKLLPGSETWPRPMKLTCTPTKYGTIILNWPGSTGMPQVSIQRQNEAGGWQTIAQTYDNVFEDFNAPVNTIAHYRIISHSAVRVLEGSCQTAAIQPLTAPTDLQARARGVSVALNWAASDLTVQSYRIERAQDSAGPWEIVPELVNLTPQGFARNRAVINAREAGPAWFRVVALGTQKQEATSTPVQVEVITRAPEPMIALEFNDETVTGPTGAANFSGPHEFITVDGRGILRTQGGLTLPYGDALQVKDAFTVAIRFNQKEQGQIPVLVAQGEWEGSGYFVQSFFGKIRFYVSGAGYLDVQQGISLGIWHTLICVYDGSSLAVFMDGTLLGEKAADGDYKPGTLPFAVARYSQEGVEWAFTGDVDFVRLYNVALDPVLVMQAESSPGSEVSLDWSDNGAKISGSAQWHQVKQFVDSPFGSAIKLDGGLSLGFFDLMALGMPFCLETSIMLQDDDAMPVIINQGLWPNEGYMLQILSNKIRFNVGGIGSLDCEQELEVGQWYKVKCEYDGKMLRCWVDDKLAGEQVAGGVMMASLRPLRIGRYEDSGNQYVFHGAIGPVNIKRLDNK